MRFREFADALNKGILPQYTGGGPYRGAVSYGGMKRIPRKLRVYRGPRGMGSRGGKVFINGAGHLQYGEPPTSFRAHVTFDEHDPRERAAMWGLEHRGIPPDEWGNHLLYQDDADRRQLVRSAAAGTGHPAQELERAYREKTEEAQRQFRVHPLHHMDNLVHLDEAGRPVRDEQGQSISLVKRTPTGDPKYTTATRPLDPHDVGKALALWHRIPRQQRVVEAKWYSGRARDWIKDVSEASGVPFMKVAAVLALCNMDAGWDVGQVITAQQCFGNALGITDETGQPRMLSPKYPHKLYPKIDAILHAPGDKMMEVITRTVTGDKLGSFLMNMIGAGDGRATTLDRHQLAIFGIPQGKSVTSGQYEYYRRVMLAAAHQLGVPVEELQAATWSYYREHGAKEAARAKGQPEHLIGTVAQNRNLPKMRAYIAQRLANVRAAKLHGYDTGGTSAAAR